MVGILSTAEARELMVPCVTSDVMLFNFFLSCYVKNVICGCTRKVDVVELRAEHCNGCYCLPEVWDKTECQPVLREPMWKFTNRNSEISFISVFNVVRYLLAL